MVLFNTRLICGLYIFPLGRKRPKGYKLEMLLAAGYAGAKKGGFMTKKKNGKSPARLLILVMTLVFALALTGCDTGSDVGNGGWSGGDTAGATDPVLNGTWNYFGRVYGDFLDHLVFNNGNFEVHWFWEHPVYPDEVMALSRGTFITSGINLTVLATNIRGGILLCCCGWERTGFTRHGWYTKDQIAEIVVPRYGVASFLDLLDLLSGADLIVADSGANLEAPVTITYFISGNVLCLVCSCCRRTSNFRRR